MSQILIKLCYFIGWPKFIRIRSGFLKNYFWTTKTSDTTYALGSYEQEAFAILNDYLKLDDVVFDIGANLGYFSLYFSKKSINGNIYSFEPIPESKKLLDTHLKINKVSNVYTFQLGISDSVTEIEFTNSKNLAANTYKKESPIFEKTSKVLVKTTTIDEFVKTNKINRLDFVKIDVEGAELDVLRGAEKTLQTLKPKLLLATHDCHIEGIKQQCLNFLTQLGYSFQSSGESKEIEGQEDFLCKPKSL